MSGRAAVFVDRDGTLNQGVIRGGHLFPPESVADFKLFPGVSEACRDFKAAGFALVVATNQPDVARGTQTLAAVEAMHARLRELVPEIDRIEVCTDPGQGEVSRRRKPAPGMLLDAAEALGIDLGRSWMVGDRWRDIECGRAAGVRTVFIDFGYDEPIPHAPDHTVRSFAEAAAVILGRPVKIPG